MAKLMLMKKAEVSVPEDKKGKQIAVKESNITSLKNFFVSNYQPPVTSAMPENEQTAPIIENTTSVPLMENPTPIEVSPLNSINPAITNSIEMPQAEVNPMVNNNTIQEKTEIVENTTSVEETPIIAAPQPMILESAIVEPMEPVISGVDSPINEGTFIFPRDDSDETTEEGTSDTEAIKLVQENNTIFNSNIDEEMDTELKEIKNRLDQVILDLNNYKKKIKMLEDEVNQNLEKSREVLKDTQAAAKIMSIHQERQKQIMNEQKDGQSLIDDSSRVLQKEIA